MTIARKFSVEPNKRLVKNAVKEAFAHAENNPTVTPNVSARLFKSCCATLKEGGCLVINLRQG